MSQRATSAQREMLMRRLASQGLTNKRLCSSDRTGPQWRPFFKLAGTPEPGDPFSWPTVDDWIGSLTQDQAHAVIGGLMKREAMP